MNIQIDRKKWDKQTKVKTDKQTDKQVDFRIPIQGALLYLMFLIRMNSCTNQMLSWVSSPVASTAGHDNHILSRVNNSSAGQDAIQLGFATFLYLIVLWSGGSTPREFIFTKLLAIISNACIKNFVQISWQVQDLESFKVMIS